MRTTICLTAILASMLLHPPTARGQTGGEFDQFADAANAGLCQGVSSSSELLLESDADASSAQAVNIVSDYDVDAAVFQKAVFEDGLSLTMSNGDAASQGINIYQRGTATEITQIAIVSGKTTITSANNSGGSIQAINIIKGN